MRAGLAGLGVEGLELRTERATRHGDRARRTSPSRGARAAAPRLALDPRADRRAPACPSGRASARRRRSGGSRIAEGRIHGIEPEQVHFHEVGAVDAIGEVCGVALALEALGIDRVGLLAAAGRPRVRRRRPRAAAAARRPRRSRCSRARRSTASRSRRSSSRRPARRSSPRSPTSTGRCPSMTLEGSGYGAGTRDLRGAAERRPRDRRRRGRAATRPVSLIEANLDDLLPELAPDAAAACFAAGALDVWTAPAQMKRGRPGFVHLRARPARATSSAVAEAMLRETSTLGVRIAHLDRIELERESRTVEVGGEPVRVKVGRLDGEVVNLAPEHADCERAARISGAPVKTVWAQALAAAHGGHRREQAAERARGARRGSSAASSSRSPAASTRRVVAAVAARALGDRALAVTAVSPAVAHGRARRRPAGRRTRSGSRTRRSRPTSSRATGYRAQRRRTAATSASPSSTTRSPSWPPRAATARCCRARTPTTPATGAPACAPPPSTASATRCSRPAPARPRCARSPAQLGCRAPRSRPRRASPRGSPTARPSIPRRSR